MCVCVCVRTHVHTHMYRVPHCNMQLCGSSFSFGLDLFRLGYSLKPYVQAKVWALPSRASDWSGSLSLLRAGVFLGRLLVAMLSRPGGRGSSHEGTGLVFCHQAHPSDLP